MIYKRRSRRCSPVWTAPGAGTVANGGLGGRCRVSRSTAGSMLMSASFTDLREVSSARISCDDTRLAVHRPEPAHLQKTGDALGIPAVRLDGHRLQRGLHPPGLHQHGLEAGVGQPLVQPMKHPNPSATIYSRAVDKRSGPASPGRIVGPTNSTVAPHPRDRRHEHHYYGRSRIVSRARSHLSTGHAIASPSPSDQSPAPDGLTRRSER